MTPPNGPPGPGLPQQPGGPISPATGGEPPATPSKLTGGKLVLIILGIVGACGVLIVGTLALAAVAGFKLFEAVK